MEYQAQSGILEPVPAHGRYLFFSLRAHATPAALAESLRCLAALADGQSVVVGVGAALVPGGQPGQSGASFVAVQQWVHDLDAFAAMGPQAQDNAMGRRRSDNEELDEAPACAHVKRTAQESFSPEAFVLRRSMPWAVSQQCGLFFVAFGCTLDAFEAQMRRMAGQEDGVVDALFGFSRPVSGAYLWCPPLHRGRLDWRQLGL